MSEFAAFDKIERLTQQITITEKIHGTNAQVFIADGIVRAGSRTRWITPEDDNYAFAAWVASNAHALRELLGEGQHFGEWYGSGINAGYGLKERRFALFNTFRWVPLADTLRPLGIDVVPILYQGPFSGEAISTAFERLRTLGSVIVPGYDKPEGIVVRFDRSGVLMKRTFESEDEAWSYKKDRPPAPDHSEVAALCAPFWQPLRLEKLLSRDERFGRDYPKSLPDLCREYIADLKAETNGDVTEETWKLVGKNAFKAIKGMMAERGFSA
jgi:hypothetical protein